MGDHSKGLFGIVACVGVGETQLEGGIRCKTFALFVFYFIVSFLRRNLCSSQTNHCIIFGDQAVEHFFVK